MKPLKIAIVDSDESSYQRLKDKLCELGGALDNFIIKYEKIGYPKKKDAEKYIQPAELLENNPDMVILDYNLSKKNGLNIVKGIRGKNNFIPIILTSRTNDPSFPTHTLVDLINENPKVIGLIDQSWEKTATQALVKGKLRRPLNVAILGLGMLGQAFLREFIKSEEIGKVNGFSERKKPHSQPIVDYDLIYRLIGAEKTREGTHHKLNLFNTLEGAIEGTDCTIISTSAVHGSPMEKIAETDDRHDLLYVEGKKIKNYAARINRAGYEGLVINMTNPIGANLILAKYKGLKADQLTSSIDVDDARFIEAIRAKLGPDYDSFRRFSWQLIGEHGDVRFAELRSSEADKELVEVRQIVTQKLIGEALKRASDMGKEQMKSASQLHTAYTQAPEEATKLLVNLANFETNPKSSYYCYETFGDVGGFIALPCKISYFPHIRVRPDENRIKNIQNGAMKEVRDIISFQGLYVRNYLTGGEYGEENLTGEQNGRKDNTSI